MTNGFERNRTESNGKHIIPTNSIGFQRNRTEICENGVSTGGLQGGTGNGLSVSQPGDPRRGGSADLIAARIPLGLALDFEPQACSSRSLFYCNLGIFLPM